MASAQNPNIEILPDESILGFTNCWYASAIKTAKRFVLPNDMSIRLINASHFLATKLAAFDGRGEEDYVMSHDLEDVICVIDGRPGMEDEVRGSATDLLQYICSQLKDLWKQRAFLEALPGHLPGDAGSQARLPDLVSKLERLAGAWEAMPPEYGGPSTH